MTRQYGNNADYLAARIARDRPDILERMKGGEYRSVRAAALEAGIIYQPHPDDIHLACLGRAWRRADLETRRAFLALMDDEIAAAYEGSWVGDTPRRGPAPWSPTPAGDIPALEALILAGESVSAVARRLGVSHRTICRWRSGQTKPSRPLLDRIEQLSAKIELVD